MRRECNLIILSKCKGKVSHLISFKLLCFFFFDFKLKNEHNLQRQVYYSIRKSFKNWKLWRIVSNIGHKRNKTVIFFFFILNLNTIKNKLKESAEKNKHFKSFIWQESSQWYFKWSYNPRKVKPCKYYKILWFFSIR